MARKLELRPNMFQWSLERCEDVVLIDAYLRVLKLVPNELYSFLVDFERNYFDRGLPVGWHHLGSINVILRRRGLDEVEFRETAVNSYAKLGGTEKAEARRKLLKAMETMTPEKRAELIRLAREETDNLPESDWTHKAWKAMRAQRHQEGDLATFRPVLDLRVKPPKEELVKLLLGASRADLQDRILENFSKSDLISLIEKIDNPSLRDRVIERAIG